jgi:AraC-like DNA-binding protein
MELLELISRAHGTLAGIVGEGWDLDYGKLERLLKAYSTKAKISLSRVSYAAKVLEDGKELVLGTCHELPYSAICLYILGRDAGIPVTVLDAVEAVARTVREGDPGIGISARHRVKMSDGIKVIEANSRVRGPEPILWYDTECYRLVVKVLKGDGEEEIVLVIRGHDHFVWRLERLNGPLGIEVQERTAYEVERLEERFLRAMASLRPRLAETGIKLVAHVGAERFLWRGLRVLGREDLWERAIAYLRHYDLGESPAYSAALAATIAVAVEPSPKPTYLDIARAFGVSEPSLKRRFKRIAKKGPSLK